MSLPIERFRSLRLGACALAFATACDLGAGHGGDPVPDEGRLQWAIGDPWVLATEPTVTIGSMDGEDRINQLALGMEGLRSSRARFLSDDRFVIADAGDNELRIHHSDGLLVATLGGLEPVPASSVGWRGSARSRRAIRSLPGSRRGSAAAFV